MGLGSLFPFFILKIEEQDQKCIYEGAFLGYKGGKRMMSVTQYKLLVQLKIIGKSHSGIRTTSQTLWHYLWT